MTNRKKAMVAGIIGIGTSALITGALLTKKLIKAKVDIYMSRISIMTYMVDSVSGKLIAKYGTDFGISFLSLDAIKDNVDTLVDNEEKAEAIMNFATLIKKFPEKNIYLSDKAYNNWIIETKKAITTIKKTI